jgi:hypothetical protein
MGMDSYITAIRTYEPEDRQYPLLFTALGATRVRKLGQPEITVSLQVAYWRSAYVIHSWFERMPAYDIGEDTVELTRFDLQDLVTTCLQARAAFLFPNNIFPNNTTYKDKVAILFNVPTGEVDHFCHFGLEETIPQLNQILAMPDRYTFQYKASI